MFAVVREIQKKLDSTILVEGPDGYVNSTEQKVKIITEYFEIFLSKILWQTYLISNHRN